MLVRGSGGRYPYSTKGVFRCNEKNWRNYANAIMYAKRSETPVVKLPWNRYRPPFAAFVSSRHWLLFFPFSSRRFFSRYAVNLFAELTQLLLGNKETHVPTFALSLDRSTFANSLNIGKQGFGLYRIKVL